MHKSAFTHIDTSVRAFAAFAEHDQIASPQSLSGHRHAPIFEFSHGAWGLELCTFLVDMGNQAAAVKAGFRRVATPFIGGAYQANGIDRYISRLFGTQQCRRR